MTDFLDEIRDRLSTRTFNVLKREGIKTEEQFFALTPEQMDGMRNFGFRSYEQVLGVQQMLLREKNDPKQNLQDRINLLRHGAAEMRKDRDARWHRVADWADLEAATLGEMEPFANLLNAVIEKQSGVKGYITFARDENGDPQLTTDTSDAAVAAVLTYLGEDV